MADRFCPPEIWTLLPKCWFDATESFWVENLPREHLSVETRQQVFRNLFFSSSSSFFFDCGESVEIDRMKDHFIRIKCPSHFSSWWDSVFCFLSNKKWIFLTSDLSVSEMMFGKWLFIKCWRRRRRLEAQLWAEPPVPKKINPVDLEFLFWVEVAQSPKFAHPPPRTSCFRWKV